jgi:hypothetical protein
MFLKINFKFYEASSQPKFIRQNPQSCLFALLLNEALLHPEGSEAQLYITGFSFPLLNSQQREQKEGGHQREGEQVDAGGQLLEDAVGADQHDDHAVAETMIRGIA